MNPTETQTLTITRNYPFSAERVYDAWLNPEMARRFLFATPTGTNVRTEIDARVGGRFSIVRRNESGDVEHVGEYLAMDRPRRLVFTFAVPKFSAASTLVSLAIAPTDSGCILTLTHEGVLPEWAERTEQGWGMILAGLDAVERQPYARLIAENTIQVERLLPGPVERVWAYLTESEKRGKWLATGEMKLEAGAPFTLFFRHAELSSIDEPIPERYAALEKGHTSQARLTRCDPPHALAFLWGESPAAQQEVTITLAPQGEQVLLQLTHRRLSGEGRMQNFAAAWHTHLGVLVALLDGREPGGFWSAMDRHEPEYERRFAAGIASGPRQA